MKKRINWILLSGCMIITSSSLQGMNFFKNLYNRLLGRTTSDNVLPNDTDTITTKTDYTETISQLLAYAKNKADTFFNNSAKNLGLLLNKKLPEYTSIKNIHQQPSPVSSIKSPAEQPSNNSLKQKLQDDLTAIQSKKKELSQTISEKNLSDKKTSSENELSELYDVIQQETEIKKQLLNIP